MVQLDQQTLLFSTMLGVAGMLSHQLKQIIESKVSKGEAFTLIRYWTDNWPQSVLSVVSTASVLILGAYAGDLNPMSAYLAGIAGNTAAELIGPRKSRISDTSATTVSSENQCGEFK
jgi:hypothetical protein